MTVKFCLLDAKKGEIGTNIGYAYIKDHMGELKDGPDGIIDYLAAGWTQGVDFIVYDDIAYMLKKTYILPDQDMIVHLCIESIRGCDVVR